MATVLQTDYMYVFVSDELHGVMGGVKNMYQNWRNDNISSDNYIDTFKQRYQQYRDASRQELNNGYQRNPLVSAGSEIISSAIRLYQYA